MAPKPSASELAGNDFYAFGGETRCEYEKSAADLTPAQQKTQCSKGRNLE